MIDRLHGRMHVRIHAEGVSGIRITIKVRKITAGNIYPDTVSFLKYIACGPQINGIFIHFTGFYKQLIGK